MVRIYEFETLLNTFELPVPISDDAVDYVLFLNHRMTKIHEIYHINKWNFTVLWLERDNV